MCLYKKYGFKSVVIYLAISKDIGRCSFSSGAQGLGFMLIGITISFTPRSTSRGLPMNSIVSSIDDDLTSVVNKGFVCKMSLSFCVIQY